ncbi:class I SAM-dependent methyltransferase [Geobacter sp. SVR]|uniref:class I SAM-dependent methyltransferase n=1 Tax=Geobacter sp. SVR TaxID=2495594 RepID=UPI00143F0057|nr:class I SAM-dependent methyltransferase [Geobacter sp. SVR]BCS52563.1 SAM-dependent methyltransferase [Geobacter sp. SVR]GCF83999.1 SAM-dependent methyltransferase [Geobacter sp. SVR]
MGTFKDHFSGRAADYTRYRPSYPPALFDWLAGLSERHELAWDCGCGNGQAALGLVPHYRLVLATDPSPQQIENAVPHEQIRYGVASAEQSGLDPASIDLIVVAQALHWFDFGRFYEEVRRVARPGGIVAAISYGEVKVAGAPDAVISRFYHDLIGPYWPPERRYVDECYATIPFPFAEIAAPPFAMEAEWSMEHLLGYLGTWSAVKEYHRQRGHDPLALIAEELAAAWGEPGQLRRISWPLALRVGRVGRDA